MNYYPWFKLDSLNGFIVLAAVLFSALTVIYSLPFMKGRGKGAGYYIYIILTAIASVAALLANNLVLLVAFWGFLGMTLYLLINMGQGDTASAAKKAFIIIGGTDALMLLGIGIIYYISGSFQMDRIRIPLYGGPSALPVIAYLCIGVACFAKAGAMPFHTWIPDCAETAPVPVVAFLPASLDKLLGIYLLARISLDLFALSEGVFILLMIIGAFTIVAAVMMALVQHDMKRLLGYHAVSQVGYMILGIGTGVPVGVAGGIFHMLNNAVYKACLFLTAGNVEHRTGTTDLDKLGGLAKVMPITYICALIASLSISGVPPFNGFVSKWMIYQGLIERLSFGGGRFISVLCLAAAMVGSGLTLASFMKLLHATYLGQRINKQADKESGEVPWQMWVPTAVLAAICIIFGVFAYQIPLKLFIFPAVPAVTMIGAWYAGLSTFLIILGLVIGILIFKAGALKPSIRRDTSFTGAEVPQPQGMAVSGTDFYNTIKEFRGLKGIYALAQKGTFDIYEQGKTLVFGIGRFFQYLHNGVLPTYIVWTLLGMIALFFILVKR